MNKETYIQIREGVENYIDKVGFKYMPSELYQDPNNLEHIINTGVGIMSKKMGLNNNVSTFERAVVANDLLLATTTADSDNIKALKFYVLMNYNLVINLK